MKRFLDLIVSFLGLIILSPILLIIAILIVIDSGFPVFFKQQRVGKGNIDFGMLKFRTMRKDADKKGLLITVGGRDSRITRVGYYLRKYKLDEFPQLFNVLKGEMSLVGPRPEVRKYVEHYSEEQMKVFSIKPGITDYASIQFRNENELLAGRDNPEEFYIKEIMPVKLSFNLEYLRKRTFWGDMAILFQTVLSIFR
ncbi:MAG: sugar transferase [Cytophagales bacterium]